MPTYCGCESHDLSSSVSMTTDAGECCSLLIRLSSSSRISWALCFLCDLPEIEFFELIEFFVFNFVPKPNIFYWPKSYFVSRPISSQKGPCIFPSMYFQFSLCTLHQHISHFKNNAQLDDRCENNTCIALNSCGLKPL